MKAEIRSQTISGLRWTAINAVGEKILSFGTTVILARILDPSDFGLYALAFIVIDSLGVLKNLGLDSAIVQRKDRVEEAADTAFMVQPILGIFIYLALHFSAPLVANALHNPEVARPMQVLGLIIIVLSLGNVPSALIQKTMRFRIRTIANLTGMVIYAVMAVILARRGAGVFSLVTAYLVRWIVCIAMQWISLGWVPRFRFDWPLFKEMVRFSKYIVGAWTIGFLSMNLDKIVIGRWLGISELGYYTLCMGLANIVTTQVSARAYQVVFPAFSQVQQAPELAKPGFLKLVKYLLLCSFPVVALLVLLPRDLLHGFYGPKWELAAPVLQVLAVFGILETLRIGTDPALLGSGKVRLVFRMNMIHLLIQGLGGLWMAMAGSLVGVGWMVSLASGLPAAIGLASMTRTLGIKKEEWIRAVRPPLIAFALMVLILAVSRSVRLELVEWEKPSGVWLLWTVANSLVVYAAAIFVMDRAVAVDILHLVGIRLPGDAKKA